MASLIVAAQAGLYEARIGLVIGSRPCPALEVATQAGATTTVVSATGVDYGHRLLTLLSLHKITLVCLAGYMRLLPSEVLEAFPKRVLNIHPALLPKFGGKGMFGIHVHEAVLAARETESGCTVHEVGPVYDEGKIIVQLRCPVETNDTAETLAARVLALEHEAYPQAVREVLLGAR